MDSSFYQPLLDYVKEQPQWLFVAIGLVALLESLAIVGIVVPGVLLLFLLATFAGSGLLSLEASLLAAGIGAVLGDGISFYIGRYFHERLYNLWPFRRYPDMMRLGASFFQRHGGKSVIVGRFIGPVRPVIPVTAGMFQMPSRQFFTYNILSAIGWAPVYVIPGFLVGASISLDIQLPHHFYIVFFSALGLLLTILFAFFHLHWLLHSEGHGYRWIQQRLQQWDWVQTAWHRLSSPRSGNTDFPLPSLILALVSLLLFILLTLAVLETRILWEWNHATSAFFRSLRQPLFDPVFVGLTLMGDVLALCILFAVFAGFLAARRNLAAAIVLVTAGGLTAASIEAMKHALEVVRPALVQIPPESFAFPSGHAGGAMVFWGLLAGFVAQEAAPQRRWQFYSLLLIPPLLIGTSRLYLNVHWLSDILGGWLWGLVICGLARVCYSPFNREPVRLGMTGQAAILSALAGVAAYIIWTYGGAILRYGLLA